MTEAELQELVVSTDKRAATLTSGVRLVRTAPYKDPREDPRVVEIFFCAAWRPDDKGNVTYGAMYTIWTREGGDSNDIPEHLRAQDGEIILLYHTLDYWTDEIPVGEYYDRGLPAVSGKDIVPLWT